MPFAAAISSASRNARRSKGRHDVSKEETRPLNPNRNDYEDIENPFSMPGEVSKFDKECVQEFIFVVMFVIFVMVFLLICAYIIYNVKMERKHSALVFQ